MCLISAAVGAASAIGSAATSTAALGALAIGSTPLNYIGQSQAAAAQQKYQNRMYTETAKSAAASYKRSTGQMQNRLNQEHASSSQQQQHNAITAKQAKGRLVTAAGEAGISGNTVDMLLADFERQQAQNAFNIDQNYDWTELQATEQMFGMQAEAKSRIASATPGPVQMPSIIGTALQIGAQAYSAYDIHQYWNRKGIYANGDRSVPLSRLF